MGSHLPKGNGKPCSSCYIFDNNKTRPGTAQQPFSLESKPILYENASDMIPSILTNSLYS